MPTKTMPKTTKTAGAANAGGPQKTQLPTPIVPPAPAVGQSTGGSRTPDVIRAEIKEANKMPLQSIYRRAELERELSAAIHDEETQDIQDKLFEFKPVFDVFEGYQFAVRNRLIGHFDYLLEKVDDLDQRILCDALELMKRTKGTEDDDFLQPGELIEAIHFLLGFGMPEDDEKGAADASVN